MHPKRNLRRWLCLLPEPWTIEPTGADTYCEGWTYLSPKGIIRQRESWRLGWACMGLGPSLRTSEAAKWYRRMGVSAYRRGLLSSRFNHSRTRPRARRRPRFFGVLRTDCYPLKVSSSGDGRNASEPPDGSSSTTTRTRTRTNFGRS